MPADFDDIIFGAINFDVNSDPFWEANVSSLPTIVYYNGGEELHRHSGASDHGVRDNINKYLVNAANEEQHEEEKEEDSNPPADGEETEEDDCPWTTGTVHALNDNDSHNALIASGKRVVIDYYADWCGPCVRFKPDYEAMPADFDNIVFAAVNYDKNSASFGEKGVRSLPTLIYYFDGAEVFRHSGASDSLVRRHIEEKLVNASNEPREWNAGVVH